MNWLDCKWDRNKSPLGDSLVCRGTRSQRIIMASISGIFICYLKILEEIIFLLKQLRIQWDWMWHFAWLFSKKASLQRPSGDLRLRGRVGTAFVSSSRSLSSTAFVGMFANFRPYTVATFTLKLLKRLLFEYARKLPKCRIVAFNKSAYVRPKMHWSREGNC